MLGRPRELLAWTAGTNPDFNFSVSLLRGLVIVAHDPRNFPLAAFVLPDVQKASLTFAFVCTYFAEAMRTRVNRAVVTERPDFERTGYEFAGKFSADVVFHIADEAITRPRDAAFVVIKLKLWDEITGQLVEMAGIERIEQRAVHGGHALNELLWRFPRGWRW